MDPIVSSASGIVDTFWGLDVNLARRKHFPSVDWSWSRSTNYKNMTDFFDTIDPEFTMTKTRIFQILQQDDELNDIVQLVGKVESFFFQNNNNHLLG